MATPVSPTISNPRGLVITLRDVAYFFTTSLTAYLMAWQVAGSPTDPKKLWAVAVGLIPVAFRKLFPNMGEVVKPGDPVPAGFAADTTPTTPPASPTA